jgi:hypothetical protein
MHATMRTFLVVLAIIVAGSGTAHAGRSYFAWLYGTDINPERGVEAETWILQENGKSDVAPGAALQNETDILWAITASLTEHVQIAIPIEAEYHSEDETDPGFTPLQLKRFGGDVRWRLQSPDHTDAGPFATLLRFGVLRLLEPPSGLRFEVDAVASYQAGPWMALVDLGAIDEAHLNETQTIEIHPGAGVSYRLSKEVRVGVESYGEFAVQSAGLDPSWAVIGPDVSVTSGRFWMSLSIGPGIYRCRDGGRITFGVAL